MYQRRRSSDSDTGDQSHALVLCSTVLVPVLVIRALRREGEWKFDTETSWDDNGEKSTMGRMGPSIE